MPAQPSVVNKFSANIHSQKMEKYSSNFVDGALQKISDEITALEASQEQKARFTDSIEKQVDEVLMKSI